MVLKKMVNGVESECTPEEEKEILALWAQGDEEARIAKEAAEKPVPEKDDPMEYIRKLCDYLKINMEDLKNGNIRTIE